MSRSLELRPFHADDGPAVASLHRRAILAVHPRFYSRAERESWAHGIDPDAYARVVVEEGEVFVLAESSDGDLLGFCSYKLRNETGIICGLYTTPEAQRQGTGSALLAHAETALAAQGAQRLVVDASLSGVAFYEHRGYQMISRTRYRTRGGLEVDIREMEKVL
ncbi:MAG: GNAT family N-acetyltransferase [Pseudomonadota bacterium]